MNKIIVLLLACSTYSHPLCCTKSQKSSPETSPFSKEQLIMLIKNSDLEGIKRFTQNKQGAACIDEDACRYAAKKFEATGISDQNRFSHCKEFLVMVTVQAMAPESVKEKLGIPHYS